MYKLPHILLLGFLFFCITSCSEDAITSDITSLEAKNIINLEYGTDSHQKYDIYLPKNRTKDTKVLILIHGGGWNKGDKSEMDAFKDFIREQLPEIAVVNMNYRLADVNTPPYPMQINDIDRVVNELRNRVQEFQISPEIGFIGASAGAHLSLLWSYAHDTKKQVKMVCSIVGPTNLLDESYVNTTDQELRELLDQFGSDPAVLEAVSPIYQVTSTSPATILFYGAQDPLIPNSQGIDLRDKLKELNVTHEFTLYPNGGHGWIGLDLLDTSIKLKAFIQNHL
ncbi:Acetyl esterase [Arenibacter antarcticus]|uniref:Alpha/beta hydrolase fold domain-containing protein n=1 Tax=Arenibacter antarcticus TaxID=2040469 RepID=A0ABW5VDB3_9FLAO|nr:alpha/beta hydrolase [Arenibacter sp. H213]MCM4168285.1 lipase [Arenibacter sp. H213]